MSILKKVRRLIQKVDFTGLMVQLYKFTFVAFFISFATQNPIVWVILVALGMWFMNKMEEANQGTWW